MEERGGACPVQHSGSEASPTAEGTQQTPHRRLSLRLDQQQQQQQQQHATTAITNGGLWSGVASWIPFRGNKNDMATIPVGERRATESENAQRLRRQGSGSNGSACPIIGPTKMAQPESRKSGEACGCPVKTDSTASTETPAYNALNNEFVYGQEKAPGQTIPLSTSRQQSSIPKGDFNPIHQPTDASTWVYPSEQQYYNAIKRKGYNASANDMPMTLAIHNAVNEQGWAMVTEWERLHGGGGVVAPAPKLLRFQGRPKDISPKAWIKTNLLGYTRPFDRHDWVVKRADGSEARYVIDFYAGHMAAGSSAPVSMYLDVRPALDSVDAVVDRVRMFYGTSVRPHLSGVLDTFSSGTASDSTSSASTTSASREDAPPSAASGVSGGR